MSLFTSHPSFLERLPGLGFKTVLFRLLMVGAIGLPLSMAFTIAGLFLLKDLNLGDVQQRMLLVIFTQNLPFFLLVLIFFYKGKLRGVYKLIFGLVRNSSFLLIFLVVLFDFAVGLALNLVSYGVFYDSIKVESLKNYVAQSPSSFDLNYIALLIFSLGVFFVIAFFEEFIFRFTIYRFLRTHGMVVSLLLSSLIFTVSHQSGWSLQTFIFGCLVAVYYEYSNNFWGAVVIHTIANQFIVFYVSYVTLLLLF